MNEFPGVFPNEFPLTIDLPKTTFSVGEIISLTAKVANNSREDLSIATSGGQPIAILHPPNDTMVYTEPAISIPAFFKSGETITRTYAFLALEAGEYILEVRYHIVVYDIYEPKSFGAPSGGIIGKLDDIIIKVE